MKYLSKMSLSAVAVVLIAPPALAQERAENSLVLEEITVTAQRREESMQDVPVSVSARPDPSVVMRTISLPSPIQPCAKTTLPSEDQTGSFTARPLAMVNREPSSRPWISRVPDPSTLDPGGVVPTT